MRFSSQNLNDINRHLQGSILKHGRCWLWIKNITFSLEWLFFSKDLQIKLGFNDNKNFSFSLGLILFTFYFGIEGIWLPKFLRSGKELSLSIHDGGIWWDVWTRPWEWSRSWRQGSFNPLDFLFGPNRMQSEEPIETVVIEVPMPEATYECNVTFNKTTWGRKRLKFLHTEAINAKIEPKEPIPVPDKYGDWDATYSMYCQASNPTEASVAMYKSVMGDRIRRGGLKWRPSPRPKQEIQDIAGCDCKGG